MKLHPQHGALMRTTSLFGLFRTDFKPRPLHAFDWFLIGHGFDGRKSGLVNVGRDLEHGVVEMDSRQGRTSPPQVH